MTHNIFPPGFESDLKTIAIDFDGVLHTYDKGYFDGTCYGNPVPGAIEAIREISKEFKIIIYSAKAKPDRPLVNGKKGTALVEEWLKKYEIFDCISSITSEKPRAILYIDDNAYRFDNWHNTLSFIKKQL